MLVATEALQTAAADAAQIGSAVAVGNQAAAIPTTRIAAAAADEVSTAVASLFGVHARQYQSAAAQAATFYDQFVRNLSGAVGAYTRAEAGIVTSLQPVGQAWINSPLGQAIDPIIARAASTLIGNTGGTETSIVIDFVRHGESIGNASGLIDTAVPGTALTQLGQQQALTIANSLAGQGPYAGIFASQLLRTQQTAAPLAAMLGMNVQALPGLNEIYAGLLNGLPEIPAGLLYLPGPLAWTLGLPIVPMLAPGALHLNGVVFDQGFTNALRTMYATAIANPVQAASGHITDVAYSSEFAIEVGTLMNVNNPDPLLMFTHPLSNTGVVVVQGNPQIGWTMTSWDGVPVPPANLPTKLFVDVRDLITTPQFVAYDGVESLLTGNPTTIAASLQTGAGQVGQAVVHFPLAVTRDLIDAVGVPGVGGLSDALADAAAL